MKQSQIINQALQHLKSARYVEAEKIFLKVIKREPTNLIAINNLAFIYYVGGQLDKAKQKLQLSYSLNNKQIDVTENLINLKLNTNDLSGVDEIFEYANITKIATKKIKVFEAIYLQKTGKFADSIEKIESVQKDNEDDENLLITYAYILMQGMYFDKAIKKLDGIKTPSYDLYMNYGMCYENLNEFQQAFKFYLQAKNFIKNESQRVEYIKSLISASSKSNSIKHIAEEDITFLERFKTNLEIQFSLALFFILVERFSEAEKSLNYCINNNHKKSECYINLGKIYSHIGNDVKSIECYRKVIDNEDNELLKDIAEYNLSFRLLANYDFENGWELYEKRTYKADEEIKNKFDKPNSINKNDNIAIVGEPGIGDQILYSTIFTDLEKVTSNVKVFIDKRLINIFSINYKSFEFIDINFFKEYPKDQNEKIIKQASLGKYFRNKVEEFSNLKKFNIIKNPKIDSFFAKKYNNEEIKIGIAWKSKAQELGKSKSIDLSEFSLLKLFKKCSLINLQYGEVKDEIDRFNLKSDSKIEVVDDLDLFEDIESLFSLVNKLDFIITTSNVTAHIAGILGKDAILLAPKNKGRMWYWHKDKISIWYPTTRIVSYQNTENRKLFFKRFCKSNQYKY